MSGYRGSQRRGRRRSPSPSPLRSQRRRGSRSRSRNRRGSQSRSPSQRRRSRSRSRNRTAAAAGGGRAGARAGASGGKHPGYAAIGPDKQREGWSRNPLKHFVEMNRRLGTPAWTLTEYLGGRPWTTQENLAWLMEVDRLGLPVHRVGFRGNPLMSFDEKWVKTRPQCRRIPEPPKNGRGYTRWELEVFKSLGYTKSSK